MKVCWEMNERERQEGKKEDIVLILQLEIVV